MRTAACGLCNMGTLTASSPSSPVHSHRPLYSLRSQCGFTRSVWVPWPVHYPLGPWKCHCPLVLTHVTIGEIRLAPRYVIQLTYAKSVMNGSETEMASYQIPPADLCPTTLLCWALPGPVFLHSQPLPGKGVLHTKLTPDSAFNKPSSSLCEFH